MSVTIGGEEFVIGGYAEYEVNKRQYRTDIIGGADSRRYPEIIHASTIVNNIMTQLHPDEITYGSGASAAGAASGATGGGVATGMKLKSPTIMAFESLRQSLHEFESQLHTLVKSSNSIKIPALTSKQVDKKIQQWLESKDIRKRFQILHQLASEIDAKYAANVQMPPMPELPPIKRSDSAAIRKHELLLVPYMSKMEELIATLIGVVVNASTSY